MTDLSGRVVDYICNACGRPIGEVVPVGPRQGPLEGVPDVKAGEIVGFNEDAMTVDVLPVGIQYYCEAAQYSHSGSWGLSREGPPLRMGEAFETDDINDLMGDAAGMRAKIAKR